MLLRRVNLTVSARGTDEVEIIVSDSGPGIPDAIMRRIFDPFFTTKAAGMGIVIVSCDGLELAGLCDRVLIFSRGHVTQTLHGNDLTESNDVRS